MRPGVATAPRDGDETGVPPRDLPVMALMRRAFAYTRPYRGRMNWLIFHVIARAFLTAVLAWLLAAVIAGPIASGDLRGLVFGAAGYLALAAFTNWMFHFRMRYAMELGEDVIRDLRVEVFTHLQSLTMGWFDRTKIGRIIGRMTSDVDSIRSGIQEVVFVATVQAGGMIIAAAFMLWTDAVLFLVVLAIAPFIWVLHREFKKRMAAAQRRAQESFSRVTANLAETVNGVRVTQGFAREGMNAGIFRDLVLDHSKYNVSAARTSAIFLPALELLGQVFVAVLLVVGGYRVLYLGMPVGNVVTFFFLAGHFFDPIRHLGNLYQNALTAMVGAERVFRLLDTKPEWTDPPDAVDLPRPGPPRGMHVEFRDVSFSYDGERTVLEGVSFVALPGQVVALVGHTGSGKTTVTGLLSKMYLPRGGTVLLDGVDILRVRGGSLRAQTGTVHQQSVLWEGTVMDNIRFARPGATAQDVIRAVESLGLGDMLEALPEGLYTVVGEGGSGLSSGQKQLVSFARAMLAQPRLLILDEATSSVDALTEARLQEALARLFAGRTSFVVAHRLSTIRAADLILVLDGGRLVERGTHAELLAAGGHYRALHDHFVESSAS